VGFGEVLIREYRRGDLDAICALDEACFAVEFRFSRESMRGFAARRGAISLVAEGDDGVIAGFVIVHLERAARGYVVTLDVGEGWRRRGLAGTLMEVAEARAREAGALLMGLHVSTGNEGAVRFYERRGYVRVGIVPGFYGMAGGSAFVYRKEL
jgi:[ribosomal protein S18]-alanine N-acetyltransferase